MRKVFLFIISLLIMLSLTGCESDPKKKEVALGESDVILYDTVLSFDEERKVGDLLFKCDSMFSVSVSRSMAYLTLSIESHPTISIYIYVRDYTDLEKTIEWYTKRAGNSSIMNINGTTWYKFTKVSAEKTSSIYISQNKEDVYVIDFKKSKGTDDVEKMFVSNLVFTSD